MQESVWKNALPSGPLNETNAIRICRYIII